MSAVALIPAQFKLLATAILAGLLAALSAAAAWQWQANSYGKQLADQATQYQAYLRQTAEANAAVILQQQADRLELEARLATFDETSTEKLSYAQKENDRLQREYAAADNERKRLRIEVIIARADAVVSQTTSAGGMGNAASFELSPAAGSAVWDIRGGMKADQVKIEYLQGYVCAIKPDAPGCKKAN